MPHRWINTELLRVIDILVAYQAVINRRPQQRQEVVLLVLAKSRILQALLAIACANRAFDAATSASCWARRP
jgi:hypothetical protein